MMDRLNWLMLGALVGAIWFAALLFITSNHEKSAEEIKQEAIGAGVAEYYINEDQEKSFRWKEIDDDN